MKVFHVTALAYKGALRLHFINTCHTLDQDTNDIDNSSVVSELQYIDINSINLNNNVSNDCDSPSIEIHNIPMSNTTFEQSFRF